MTLEPRFADVDPLHHLNNVVIAGYYYEARVAFISWLFDEVSPVDQHAVRGRTRMLVRRVEVDYLLEGRYPGTLSLAGGVTGIRTRSWSMGFALHQFGRCIGTSSSV